MYQANSETNMFNLIKMSQKIFIGLIALGYASFLWADKATEYLIGGYGVAKFAQEQLAAPPADTLVVPEGVSQLLYSTTPTNPLAITQTQQGLAGFFTLNGIPINQNNIINNIINNTLAFGQPNSPVPTTTGLYASCGATVAGGSGDMAGCLRQKIAPPFANVDLNALLGPLIYKENADKTAISYINSAASLNYPLKMLDLNRMAIAKKVDVSTFINYNDDVKKYLTHLKAYAAAQATGVSNLYQFFAERVPSQVTEESNKELYKALNSLGMPNASQLQVENYMATRRITDPTWVASLSQDSPAALLRQIAILLAENLAESYNSRLATERLTATLSILSLQQAASTRILIEQEGNRLQQQQPEKQGLGGTAPP